MKKLLKELLGRFYCALYHVKYSKGLYIGLGSKLVGGGMIRLSPKVTLMPQTMLISLGCKGIIEIGEASDIGMYSRIGSKGYVKIGKNVLTGPNVFIADYNYEYRNIERPVMYQGVHFSPKQNGEPNLIIDDGTWLGTNVVVVGNVHIGRHCVIGANSVVNKDIPDYSVAAGSPCKVIKRYNLQTNKWERKEGYLG